jgi:hypothetical protein
MTRKWISPRDREKCPEYQKKLKKRALERYLNLDKMIELTKAVDYFASERRELESESRRTIYAKALSRL